MGSIASPLHETGYDSSIAFLRGLLRRPLLNGEAGRRGVVNAGVMNLPLESTPGDECALCMRGIVNPVEVCGLVIVEGEVFLEWKGNWCIIGLLDRYGSLSVRLNRIGLLRALSESSSESNGGDGGSLMSFGDS